MKEFVRQDDIVQPEIQLRSFHRSVGLIKMKAIILAGGESSRFGKAKAFAKIDNQYFYQNYRNVKIYKYV